MNRTLAVPAVAALTLTATFALAGAASAHVTVNPDTATGGSYAKLTFRVPTESDTASTTKLAVYFPQSPAFASVSVKPHPGWTFKVDKNGENVSDIVWTPTSAAGRIKPGEFDEFDISLGPLPTSGTVVFKALQSYSDGSVVRWIDPTVAGQPEPSRPAPVLTLTPASASPAAASTGATSTNADAAPVKSFTEKDDSSTAPLILSIIALVLAAGSLVLSAVRRKRS